MPHLFFTDEENGLLFKVNITVESSLQEILNSDLFFLNAKNNWKEEYEKLNFSFKDYLHNPKEIITYIKLIDY